MSQIDFQKLTQAIADKPRPGDMPAKIIAIDGHGGSGKSTLAEKLSQKLNAEILHTDDFASWNNPYDWWPMLIQKVFEPIRNGARTLNYERSSWLPGHAPEPVKRQAVTQIMILEGVSSSRKEFRPYLAYSIWADTPKEICIARGVRRDGENMRKQWEKWWAHEEKYIQAHRPIDYADVIVNGFSEYKFSDG